MAPQLFPPTTISNIRNQFVNPYQNTQIPGMSINIPTMLQQTNRPANPQLVGVHGFDSVKQFPTNRAFGFLPNNFSCDYKDKN
ncbi:MAG: hypothetical protein II038_00930 [Lachnospiraceae bacterium]|nr:hypothetical protein [Lachnospiraceae bacterium]